MIFKELFTADNLKKYGINISFVEAVIEPGNIKLKSTDINYVSKKYPEIMFSDSEDLNGYFDANTNTVHIEYDYNNTSIDELEAMIGHEIIHSIQHKKSNGEYLKQSNLFVKEINKLSQQFSDNPTDDNQYKYYNKLAEFTLATPQEKMSYAYQFVKDRNSSEYKFKNVNDIIKYLEKYNNHRLAKIKFKIDKQFKKYIGMYWLIKDQI